MAPHAAGAQMRHGPFVSWLRRLVHPKSTAPIRRPRRPLTVEALEERVVPVARFWDAGGDGQTWLDARNWSGDAVPTANDDVTIDVPGTTTVVVRGVPSAVKSLVNYEVLHVAGAVATGAARLTVTGDVSNFGTIRLESTSDDGADRGSYLTVGGTLTNAAGGVVEANVGAGDAR